MGPFPLNTSREGQPVPGTHQAAEADHLRIPPQRNSFGRPLISYYGRAVQSGLIERCIAIEPRVKIAAGDGPPILSLFADAERVRALRVRVLFSNARDRAGRSLGDDRHIRPSVRATGDRKSTRLNSS